MKRRNTETVSLVVIVISVMLSIILLAFSVILIKGRASDKNVVETSDISESTESIFESEDITKESQSSTDESESITEKTEFSTEAIVKVEIPDSYFTFEDGKTKETTVINVGEIEGLLFELEEYVQNSSPLFKLELSEEELEEIRENSENNGLKLPTHSWVYAKDYLPELINTLGDAYDEELSNFDLLNGDRASMPAVALYYKDLESNACYIYDPDSVFDSASVIKAPYIAAVVNAINEYSLGNTEELMEISGFEDVEDIDRMFDPERKLILDHATMDTPGSGVLKDAPDRSEYTYDELIKFALEKSDNIAFMQIKRRYGNVWFYNLCKELGIIPDYSYIQNLSVKDTGTLFEYVYQITLDNEKYGQLIKDSMKSSSHTVLAKNALHGEVAHKYGWDIGAYHDAAIVYGERPYIAIVFTDIDCGGREADEFIKKIFTQIEKLHNKIGEYTYTE